ncbi:TIGR01244 family phosphatase [Sulfitobacter sp. S0837]|uniref:TIGR01244 family sulfur transferase n=1 Tax=Sulfitobacter maritimus TaxID=2741719 RepID=UPI00158182A8|nr:TIGR01244 family sulfur transferase [Sulfitobacter maritimus]NUH64605.1 TIGR01244 family phosphatase [Sulfitobacter maritimus]
MDIRQLTPRYFVAPQIDPGDMEDLRAQGITRILCNRPDAEVPPSHQAAALRNAAEAAGIAFAEQPLTHQTMTPEVIANNRALGVETDDVVLAYCASGTRSTIAWALGQAGQMDSDAIVEAAAKAGYDLASMRPMLGQSFT